MKTDVDATEYATLASLPKLQKLRLRGNHRAGTLVKCFEGLEGSVLKYLEVLETFLSKQETQAISKIKTLSRISSGFSDEKSIANLAKSRNLESVDIYVRPGQIILMDHLINLFKKSAVNIIGCNFYIALTEELGRLKVSLNDKDNFEPYRHTKTPYNKDDDDDMSNHITRVAQLPNIYKFYLSGTFKGSILKAVFEGLASREPQLLKKIDISRCFSFSPEHANILASIPSLTNIVCKASNFKDTVALKVQQLNAIKEITSRVDRNETELCNIFIIHKNSAVKLILDFTDKLIRFPIIDLKYCARFFEPLASLNNLKTLLIKGHIGDLPLINLIKLIENLEELHIKVVSPEDLTELVRVHSLKVLECGFCSSRNIEYLVELNYLETLTITDHPEGSLTTLFKALASKEDQVLLSLSIHKSLTSEEIFELAELQTLERLQLGKLADKSWQQPTSSNNTSPKVHSKSSEQINNTPFNFELLANLSNIRELSIHINYASQAVYKLLRTIISRFPQRMRLLSLPFQQISLVSQFKELKFLECSVYHVEDLRSLSPLRNLVELQIHNTEENITWALLKELHDLRSLQNLLLDDTHLEFLDVVEVTKINWLTTLRLGLADKRFVPMLAQLKNLEDLEITSTHYAGRDESHFVPYFLESCRKLKSIYLHRYYNLFTKDYVKGILNSIKLYRDPTIYPPLELRGIFEIDSLNLWSSNDYDDYDDAYLNLELRKPRFWVEPRKENVPWR
ncbi:uncharacterized protein LOC119560341 [Drosophila subpulchrella]|uniref:uncharacterized protein LOC119560341 n=1 Tax=Drosophila subpulchrella TaxID=1486046 RepID=UPI0018A1941D|nr:uncharacterized protein LOC119560341 [Drosophila subpulchrella]XP_037729661.1 uncharacterized protein LOC119560341 [Drosophila subpulchrella]